MKRRIEEREDNNPAIIHTGIPKEPSGTQAVQPRGLSSAHKETTGPNWCKGPVIVTLGDVGIDWLFFDLPKPITARSTSEDENRWRERHRVETVAIHGGAWLMETFIRALLLSDPGPGMKPSPRENDGHPKVEGDGAKGNEKSSQVVEPARKAEWAKRVYSYYRFDKKFLRAADPDCLVHSVSEYQLYPKNTDEQERVYRCARNARYWGQIEHGKQLYLKMKAWLPNGPKTQTDFEDAQKEKQNEFAKALEETFGTSNARERLSQVARYYPDADLKILVMQDTGDGFRRYKENWEYVLPSAEPQKKAADKGLVIVMYIQDVNQWYEDVTKKEAPRELWKKLGEYGSRTAVIVSANALRRAGVNISKSLSWERTGHDFTIQAETNDVLKELTKCGHLVVRFGLTGVIHYSTKGTYLYYDPEHIEGDYRTQAKQGDMVGYSMLLTATIATTLFVKLDKCAKASLPDVETDLYEAVSDGIQDGIANCRHYHRQGFREIHNSQKLRDDVQNWDKADGVLHPECPEKYNGHCPKNDPISICAPNRERIFFVEVKRTDPNWAILKATQDQYLIQIAEAILNKGIAGALSFFTKKQEFQFPVVRFEKLVTVDRKEIESYRSIRNLMKEYHAREAQRPLSIAVFGPPGSGKSFGVKQIAKSISGKESETLEYNLSQFSSPTDLSIALIWARDFAFEKRVPLVFFDEFDSELNGVSLGWLKYFLSVMQDGKFKHGERMLSVGKAIFVFAGGTSTSYEEFCRNGKVDRASRTEFEKAKGPDFLSRLRGHVNIIGPDKSSAYQDDEVFIIRRAILLRGMVESDYRRLLLKGDDQPIAPGVLRALLQIDKYKHGARSMAAILEMSALANAARFEKSLLPSEEQLDMHVDGHEFLKLVNHPDVFGPAERERDFSEAISKGLLVLQPGFLVPNIDQVISDLDRALEDFPGSRIGTNVLAKLYRHKKKDLKTAIEVLSRCLEAMKSQGDTKPEDVAAVLYNRACYNCLIAATIEGSSEKARLHDLVYQDLKNSFPGDPGNAKLAFSDQDFASIRAQKDFLDLVRQYWVEMPAPGSC